MRTFDRFAGTSAILVGLGGLVYGVLYGAIVLGASRPVRITWLAVGLLGALLTTPVLVALYYRLRDTDRGFALLALLPRGLGSLASAGGVLLVLVYLGRLTGVIDPATEVTTLPPLLYGLVVHPVFYVWLGVVLRRTAA
jgi:hypothetical protein